MNINKTSLPKWVRKKLGDICTFAAGGTPSTKEPSYWANGTIKWISAKCIEGDKVIGWDYITEKALKNSNSKLAHKGDLILVTRVSVGKLLFCQEELAVNQDLTIINTGKENPKYIFYLLKGKTPVILNRRQGLSIKGITKDELKNIIVHIPENCNEQQKIVEVLETWDEAIQLTRKLIEQKELQKKYLMQQLLTGRTRLKGFTDSWTEEPFRKLINIYQGYPFKSSSYVKNGTYRIITIANVQQGQLDTTKCNYINELPKNLQTYQRLQIGDLIFSMTGNVGRSCWVSRDNCLLNQRVGKIQTKKINNQFLYHFLQNPKFIYDMIVCAQGGAQANLSVKDILKYHIYFPSDITEQKSIAKILSLNDKEIDLLRQKLAKLEEQKKGLMQVLLNGKVRLQVGK